jgi:hypothetical protein
VRTLAAIDPDQIKVGALVGLGVLVVLAFLVMRFIQKMVLKLIIVVVLVGAGLFVYSQRSSLDDCQEKLRSQPQLGEDPGDRCVCGFVGIDVTIPECEDLLKGNPPG